MNTCLFTRPVHCYCDCIITRDLFTFIATTYLLHTTTITAAKPTVGCRISPCDFPSAALTVTTCRSHFWQTTQKISSASYVHSYEYNQAEVRCVTSGTNEATYPVIQALLAEKKLSQALMLIPALTRVSVSQKMVKSRFAKTKYAACSLRCDQLITMLTLHNVTV